MACRVHAWFNHYNSHNLGQNVIILADYDRPPGRKISGKGISFPSHVVFVLVNKNGMSCARENHINQQRKDPIPSDFSHLNSIAKIICKFCNCERINSSIIFFFPFIP